MANFKEILEDLEWRGLVQDISDRKGILGLSASDSFYFGCDPTAPSLHHGHLMGLILCMRLGRAGLKPILLFGGATGFIGDPKPGKERSLLDEATVSENVRSISAKVREMCERAGFQPTFVNNYDWTKDFSALGFLRDVGKYFTVNYMLQKEVVKTRLDGEGISYTEFSYMLLQALDFLHLYQTKNCRLQIGGSDQWGNITAGLEYIRKKLAGEAYALSYPLLTDSSGKKFGKSEGNAIFLDAKLTSPFKFHQFWLNVADADAARFLKLFTFMSQSEIAELEAAAAAQPQKRLAQNKLADEVCTLVHGAEATALARKSAEVLFGGSIEGLTDIQLLDIFAEVPSKEMDGTLLLQKTVLDLFVDAGLAPSKGEAKRLVTSGGAYVNSQRISDPQAKASDLAGGGRKVLVLRSGKKSYALVKVTG